VNLKARYEGKRKTREVIFRQKDFKTPLSLRVSQKIINHSPTGFNWSYRGSGAAQLALAILIDIEDTDFAVKHYQRFKEDIIAKLPKSDFILYLEEIEEWVKTTRLAE